MSKEETLQAKESSPESVTAVDVLQEQLRLERDAREALPYDPTECTYKKGPIRQAVYACLSCNLKQGGGEKMIPAGVCYSCSISCHADHDLVELFAKRNFTCDCGTERLSRFGGCNLRKNFSKLDEPSKTNKYNHNFFGKFCSCQEEYSPDTCQSTMHQCLLGDACGEDWYHERCIIGSQAPLTSEEKLAEAKEERPDGDDSQQQLDEEKKVPDSPPGHPTGVRLIPQIDDNIEIPSSDKGKDKRTRESGDEEEGEDENVLGFPEEGTFDAFICWKCTDMYRDIFLRLVKLRDIALPPVNHYGEPSSGLPTIQDEAKADMHELLKRKMQQEADGGSELPLKRLKETNKSNEKIENPKGTSSNDIDLDMSGKQFSVFLVEGFQDRISKLDWLKAFTERHPQLVKDEPAFEPPPDDDDDSSLYDAGTRALSSLPHMKAVESIHAYNNIKARLEEFLQPFAESGKIVTELDVREFFAAVQASDSSVKG